jgi:imidazole glycerol phosphate synthase subunit HisF
MINRVIAPMLIKDGVLVQSKKYKWHLPIGDIEESAIQLEYFNIDEFTLISLDGMKNSCVDVELLRRLRKATSYPITYAGGVTSLEQLRIAFDVGAERVIVNRMLSQRVNEVEEFAKLVGRQGIVGSFDITVDKEGDFFVRTIDSIVPLDINHISEVSSIVGEINLGLIDWEGSTESNSYEKILHTLLKLIHKINCPVTLYGGSFWFDFNSLASDNTKKISIMPDNILSYKEDSVNDFNEKLRSL